MKKTYIIIIEILIISGIIACSDIINSDSNLKVTTITNIDSNNLFTKDMLLMSPLIIGPMKANLDTIINLKIFNNSDLNFNFKTIEIKFNEPSKFTILYGVYDSCIIKPNTYYYKLNFDTAKKCYDTNYVRFGIVFLKPGIYRDTITINYSKILRYEIISIIEE